MNDDFIFELSGTNPAKRFSFKESFSYISITKIIINFHESDTNWLNQLLQLQPRILIKCSNASGGTMTKRVTLSAYMTPSHAQPVFDFQNLVVPEDNKLSKFSLGPASFNAAEIFLDSNDNKKLSVTILYSKTPGAEICE